MKTRGAVEILNGSVRNWYTVIVPNITKKLSERRSNKDVKVRIHEIEACYPHTRVDTRSDGTIGFHFEMGYREKRIQDRKIFLIFFVITNLLKTW